MNLSSFQGLRDAVNDDLCSLTQDQIKALMNFAADVIDMLQTWECLNKTERHFDNVFLNAYLCSQDVAEHCSDFIKAFSLDS